MKKAQNFRESGAASRSRFEIGGPCIESEARGSRVNRDSHGRRTTTAQRPSIQVQWLSLMLGCTKGRQLQAVLDSTYCARTTGRAKPPKAETLKSSIVDFSDRVIKRLNKMSCW